jgi:hypothetical protein
MEVSPLSQQLRPESFQPKVVRLYESLFKVRRPTPQYSLPVLTLTPAKDDDEVQKSEGFWQEFFLLKPDPKSLLEILDDLSAEDLLDLQAHPQQLVIRAVARIKAGVEPSDENALDVGLPEPRTYPGGWFKSTVLLGGIYARKAARAQMILTNKDLDHFPRCRAEQEIYES